MEVNKILQIVTGVLAIIRPSCYCHTIKDTNRLLKDKLADYNRNTRPTYNQSLPTVVNFGFEIFYIQEFDEVQQKLSVVAGHSFHWDDELMMWNPADYGGLSTIVTESGPFWTPNFILINSIGDRDRTGDDWQMIRFYAGGSAYYYPTELYSSACGVDVTYYPWDIHNCFLLFLPQGQFPNEVNVTVTSNKVLASNYIENGGWTFVDSRMQTFYSTYHSEISVELILERKPRYVIVNVILPIIFMAFLSDVVFLIPADCGERISYSITVLLAIAVYLTLVGDNLPKTSIPMSYFSYYLLALLLTSICIAMATIFNLRIYHSDEADPVTGCWAMIARCFKCDRKKSGKGRILKNNSKEANPKQIHVPEMGYVFPGNIRPTFHGNDYKLSPYLHIPKVHMPLRGRRHSELIDIPENTSSDVNSDRVKHIFWKDVSVALDKIFFLAFFTILSAATIIYAVIIFTSERAKLSSTT